MSSCLNKAY